MTNAPAPDFSGLNLREQIARIDRELASHGLLKPGADRFAPWQIACTGMIVGAALFAAGGVFAAALLKLHG